LARRQHDRRVNRHAEHVGVAAVVDPALVEEGHGTSRRELVQKSCGRRPVALRDVAALVGVGRLPLAVRRIRDDDLDDGTEQVRRHVERLRRQEPIELVRRERVEVPLDDAGLGRLLDDRHRGLFVRHGMCSSAGRGAPAADLRRPRRGVGGYPGERPGFESAWTCAQVSPLATK
jgi:hypothetical protein